jgi:hypothetical protein
LPRAPFATLEFYDSVCFWTTQQKKLGVNELSTILENLRQLSLHGDCALLPPPLTLEPCLIYRATLKVAAQDFLVWVDTQTDQHIIKRQTCGDF